MGAWSDWLKSGATNYDAKNNESLQFYEDLKGVAFSGGGLNKNFVVIKPNTPDDVKLLLSYIKKREPAYVNLNETNPDFAQRVLDFISGSIYALNGSMHRPEGNQNIFLLIPQGVEITIPYK